MMLRHRVTVRNGPRNKWVHFPKTSGEKAAGKEGFLRRGAIPGVIGYVDGSLIVIIAPKGDRKAAFMCRKGYYALNCIFASDSGYPLEPWLLTPVPGHPLTQTAEGNCNTAHAAMRSVVERCIELLKSCLRCRQRYRTLFYQPERVANIVMSRGMLHNLRLFEGDAEDDDDSDDDRTSSSSSGELHNNGDPRPCPEIGGLD
ncbi:hypothetical protein HPB49_000706 [Dermacentor silvarum]|uniref:Uncharacterized protein n=1 Tax=Dermacentor silvarum TaxID=543639 RepID=A0ACB8D1P7_DERSI|nr:hypothetical protein HPB49_000706 [Dermacentor silvarum]